MPRSDEAEWWFAAVYEAVKEIPHGKVTSYGHIALLLGYPQRARQVGVCLKHLPAHDPATQHYHHSENVPWQRVLNSKGHISPRGPGSVARHTAALQQEGVTVETGSLGEAWVNLGEYGWFPRRLPSEEGGDSDSDAEIKSEEGVEE